MKDKIEEMIINDVKERIAQVDIEKLFDEKRIKKLINDEVEAFVRRQIGEMYEKSLAKALYKYQSITDVHMQDKVREIFETISAKI